MSTDVNAKGLPVYSTWAQVPGGISGGTIPRWVGNEELGTKQNLVQASTSGLFPPSYAASRGTLYFAHDTSQLWVWNGASYIMSGYSSTQLQPTNVDTSATTQYFLFGTTPTSPPLQTVDIASTFSFLPSANTLQLFGTNATFNMPGTSSIFLGAYASLGATTAPLQLPNITGHNNGGLLQAAYGDAGGVSLFQYGVSNGGKVLGLNSGGTALQWVSAPTGLAVSAAPSAPLYPTFLSSTTPGTQTVYVADSSLTYDPVAHNLSASTLSLTGAGTTASSGILTNALTTGNVSSFGLGSANTILGLNNSAALTWLSSVPVAIGGTGQTFFTATNQPICGGTTTTGALQQVAAGSQAGLPLISGTSGTGLPAYGMALIAGGGTGAAAFTNNGAVIVNPGATALTSIAPGAAGHLFKSNGTSWVALGIGLANQVLTTNAAQNDIVWAPNGLVDVVPQAATTTLYPAWFQTATPGTAQSIYVATTGAAQYSPAFNPTTGLLTLSAPSTSALQFSDTSFTTSGGVLQAAISTGNVSSLAGTMNQILAMNGSGNGLSWVTNVPLANNLVSGPLTHACVAFNSPGTNITAFTAYGVGGGVLFMNSANSAPVWTGAGTTGQVLTVTTTGVDPSWQAPAASASVSVSTKSDTSTYNLLFAAGDTGPLGVDAASALTYIPNNIATGSGGLLSTYHLQLSGLANPGVMVTTGPTNSVVYISEAGAGAGNVLTYVSTGGNYAWQAPPATGITVASMAASTYYNLLGTTALSGQITTADVVSTGTLTYNITTAELTIGGTLFSNAFSAESGAAIWTGGALGVAGAGSGLLPVTYGGTGASTLAGNGALVMNAGGTTVTSVPASLTAGYVLASNGTTFTSQAPSSFTVTATFTGLAAIAGLVTTQLVAAPGAKITNWITNICYQYNANTDTPMGVSSSFNFYMGTTVVSAFSAGLNADGANIFHAGAVANTGLNVNVENKAIAVGWAGGVATGSGTLMTLTITVQYQQVTRP